MRVWLAHIGELLPGDTPFRPFRYSWLADALLDAGHEVTRWAPTFVHAYKSYRANRDDTRRLRPGFTLELLHAGSYRRNVSIGRIRFYRTFARRLKVAMESRQPPDIIVSAIPSPEAAFVAGQYARRHGIPHVVDVRDLWPDVLLHALPRPLRRPSTPLLFPWRRLNRVTLAQATAITAVSETYLSWGVHYAGRTRRTTDRAFYLGYAKATPTNEEEAQGMAVLRDTRITNVALRCCFSGQFERSCDLFTVVEAARILWEQEVQDVQFVLCGNGRDDAAIRARAAGLKSVTFSGWVSPGVLGAVMSRSGVGLAAYREGALQSIPNKIPEYVCHGLAVLSSLGGEAAAVLHDADCGLTYKPGDAAQLVSQIRQFRDSPHLLSRTRANARGLFDDKFDYSKVYPRMVQYLESLVRR